ncbi:hypothetical protein GCM10009665_01410 [Kitasatospora nipponensis]|uniref:MinD-like ATPase involved in chromosome partitioning or flagellar assembly n=1 Tax=Kitasatospora nipponensis TaxID=258049 RepID=A0ABP4G7V4_9ACTN
MTVIVLGCAKGAPGVSTTALALAAAWPDAIRPLVVEADAGGGDALLRFGLPDSPGLVSLAAASRRAGLSAALVREHAQVLPGGVEVVPGPAEAAQCAASLEALGPAWSETESDGEVLIVDCGRLLAPVGARTELLGAAQALVLVTAGTVESLAHTAEAAERMRPRVACLVIAVVGACSWPSHEVQAALGADGCLVLPHDARSAALLCGRPAPRRWWQPGSRHPLLDAARLLALDLRQRLPAPLPDEGTPPWEDEPMASARRGEPV